MNKKMLVKTMIGLLIVAVVLPPVLLGGIPMECLIAFVAFFSAYEIVSLVDQKQHMIRTACLFCVIEVLAHLSDEALPIGISGLLILLFAAHLASDEYSMDEVVYTFTLSLILVYAAHGIFKIYSLQGGAGMLFVGLACYLCDTGAYFFGSFLGKHKMIPRISPNKTWEGAFGGYAVGALGSYLFGTYFCGNYPAGLLIAASLILPAIGEIGDLAFSAVKRRFGLKDFGSLLPGHGGVLDRVDSLLFCLMVMKGLISFWGL